MAVSAHLCGVLLEVLLKSCVILLRRLQVPGLNILPQLFEGLRQGIAARSAGRAAGQVARQILRKSGEVCLGLRQIAGLQVLA